MTPFDPTRTLFIGIGMSAPCWYRCALPAMQLGAEWCGVRGEAPKLQFVTGASTRALDVEELFSYDTVVLQQPRGAGWLKLIRRLQAAGVTVLFEIDDDVHAVRKIASHAHRGTYGKNYVRDIELNMRACDGLIVATEFLAQRYRPLNPRVWVCRNGLDLGRFDLTPPGNGDQVTIGWAGGTGHEEAGDAVLDVGVDERIGDDRDPQGARLQPAQVALAAVEVRPSCGRDRDVEVRQRGRVGVDLDERERERAL